jgi:hypothetical protein
MEKTKPRIIPKHHTYDELITGITDATKKLSIWKFEKSEADGRIHSAIKEQVVLQELKRLLEAASPGWKITIAEKRVWYDVEINGLKINLKLSDCKANDNAFSKKGILYTLTGNDNYPASMNFNNFFGFIQEARGKNLIKTTRDRLTEYHYLVINKHNGDVLLKSILDIKEYNSNPSNDLQINWQFEFQHGADTMTEEEYLSKMAKLVSTVQMSVRQSINNSIKFAEADVNLLFDSK